MKQKTENTILTVVKAKLLYFILLRGKVKVATGQVAAPQLRPTPATLPYGRVQAGGLGFGIQVSGFGI